MGEVTELTDNEKRRAILPDKASVGSS